MDAPRETNSARRTFRAVGASMIRCVGWAPIALPLCLLGTLLSSGCTTTSSVQALRVRNEALQRENTALEARIRNLEDNALMLQQRLHSLEGEGKSTGDYWPEGGGHAPDAPSTTIPPSDDGSRWRSSTTAPPLPIPPSQAAPQDAAR